MRRKIPRQSREEINRRSAEKQQMIIDYMTAAGKSLSVKDIASGIPQITVNDIRRQVENLKLKGLLDRTDRDKDGFRYRIVTKRNQKADPYRNVIRERLDSQALWPYEVQRAQIDTKVGEAFIYLDDEGLKRRTRVTDTRFRHVCLFDNGQSYTWADVARCRRNRKGNILGQWPA